MTSQYFVFQPILRHFELTLLPSKKEMSAHQGLAPCTI